MGVKPGHPAAGAGRRPGADGRLLASCAPLRSDRPRGIASAPSTRRRRTPTRTALTRRVTQRGTGPIDHGARRYTYVNSRRGRHRLASALRWRASQRATGSRSSARTSPRCRGRTTRPRRRRAFSSASTRAHSDEVGYILAFGRPVPLSSTPGSSRSVKAAGSLGVRVVPWTTPASRVTRTRISSPAGSPAPVESWLRRGGDARHQLHLGHDGPAQGRHVLARGAWVNALGEVIESR